MVRFTATLKRFDSNGEKTGWTYIDIPSELSQQIKPGQKQTFRVKGKIDQHPIAGVALMPIGGGNFILTVNATMRKAIKKQKGATVQVQLSEDKAEIKPPAELVECLSEEPEALNFFQSLTKGHQNYFTKWIESAKTETTRSKRIADTVIALSKKMDFGSMIRSLKKNRKDLLREL